MAIHGAELTAMLDLNKLAEAILPTSNRDTSTTSSIDRRARRRRIVDPQMRPEHAQHRMEAPPRKFGADSGELEWRLQQVALEGPAAGIVKLRTAFRVSESKGRIDPVLVAELCCQDATVLHKLAVAMLFLHSDFEMIARLQLGVEVNVVRKSLGHLQRQIVTLIHFVQRLEKR